MDIQIKFPRHAKGLSLIHNEHKSYYDSIEEYVDRIRDRFKDSEAVNRSIATNEVWELQWYPDTPVGFLHVAAPTLNEVMELALEVENADSN